MTVEVYGDADQLADAAADLLLARLNDGVRHLLLAGGTTPARTYELLARRAGPAAFARVHLFFGDERMVAPDHPESNYGMIRRAWLDPAGVSPALVHRIRGELDPAEAARLAEQELRSVIGEPAAVDLALLGMGADGHTASLFPGSSALGETRRLYVPAREGRRISATLPLLNAANQVIFLVSGAGKAEAVRTAVEEPRGAVPASLVQPASAPPMWLLDAEAASRLS